MNWISVKKALPPDDKYVLWLFENGYVVCEDIPHDADNDYVEKMLKGSEQFGKITHWCRINYPSQIEYVRCSECDTGITIDQVNLTVTDRNDIMSCECPACGMRVESKIFKEDEE